MRAAILFVAFLPWPPLQMARAQDHTFSFEPPPTVTALPGPNAVATFINAADLFNLPEVASVNLPEVASVRRDRGRGALYGLAIGALAGGAGAATASYVLTTSTPRDAAVRIMFAAGAVVGGAAGAAAGAIIGAPRPESSAVPQDLVLAAEAAGISFTRLKVQEACSSPPLTGELSSTPDFAAASRGKNLYFVSLRLRPQMLVESDAQAVAQKRTAACDN